MGVGSRGPKGLSSIGHGVVRTIGVVAATLTSSLAVAVLVPGSSPVLAASITVTTTADGIDAAATCPAVTLASLPGPDGQTTLREAVCAANTNSGADTITFSVNGTFTLAGAANEDNGGSGDLDVKQSLQVSGNGAANTIIDGGGIERIFDVFPSSASTFGLSGLTLQHGDTRSTSFKEGGALYLHNNVTTTLTSVTVKDSFAGANGAIANRGNLTISSSVISGNTTTPASGGANGGGVHNIGTLSITNSTFSGNTVRGNGGGLFTATLPATAVTISNTTFSGNSATDSSILDGNGAAIATTLNTGTLSLTNVTMSGNRADNSGGGAFLNSAVLGSFTLNNVTATLNVADADNDNIGLGGGLGILAATVTLRNSIVAGNTNSISTVRDDIAGAVQAASANNLVGVSTGLSGITNGTNSNQIGTSGSPVDPLLLALADNGGPTQTHALQPASPAINAGNGATCAASDQRGVARFGTCDKGAYELNDTTPPDTTITAYPSNPSTSSTASFSFIGSDTGGSGLAGYQCQLDGGGFTACTSPRAYAGITDGSHTFQVRAVDGQGNIDPTPASYTWIVDTTPPDTTITAYPTNPSNSAGASFSFTGNDGSGTGVASFECQLDGGGFTACTDPQAYAGLADGAHTFQVRAIDTVGNVDPTPASYAWVVDATAPDTTITANPTDPTSSTSASFSFTGSDPGGTGLASFECQLDGGGFAPCTSPQSFSSLLDGPHTFLVRAIDGAGNLDPTPASFTWTVDTGAPGTIITDAPLDPSASAGASFSFTGDDGTGTGVGSFECQLDGGGFAPCTSPQAYVGLADGSHTFEVRAIDSVGTPDPTPATYTWLVDTTAPDTTITGQPADPSNSAGGSFSFTGSDGGSGVASFECQVDGGGGGFVACTDPQILASLTDGTHTFRVRAVDGAGNADATPASYTWTIDTTAPDTTITGQPAGQSSSAGASFAFSGSDTGGTGVTSFQCQLDGGGFTACTSPQAYAGLADGSHTFQVRAVDAAGNVDPTPAAATWVVDTTAPDTTITSTPASPSGSAAASFAFTGSDAGGSGVASFECRLDSAAFATCTSPQAVSGLADGSHSFEVRAVDGAGNADQSPASFTWTVDTTGPETTITAAPPSANAGTTASFSFIGSDGGGSGVVSFECKVDGAVFAPCTSPQVYSNLAAGSHTFQVRAVDAVANVDGTPATVTWTVAEVASQAGQATTTTAAAAAVLPSGGSLPATGNSGTHEWLTYGLVLLGAGLMLLTVRGRRRRA